MPITKLGAELIKYATPRWRMLFQLLDKANHRRIQRGGIMKSQRNIFLGRLRGNQNKQDRPSYTSVDPAKAFQPGKPIDMFKNHESEFLRNAKKPVQVGNDIIQSGR